MERAIRIAGGLDAAASVQLRPLESRNRPDVQS
jgi:hypothetical protein